MTKLTRQQVWEIQSGRDHFPEECKPQPEKEPSTLFILFAMLTMATIVLGGGGLFFWVVIRLSGSPNPFTQ